MTTYTISKIEGKPYQLLSSKEDRELQYSNFEDLLGYLAEQEQADVADIAYPKGESDE